MNQKMIAVVTLVLAMGMMAGSSAQADTFGSGANIFTLDFVPVGNAGNGNDFGAGGGSYSSLYGGVAYNYRISTYEINQNHIITATAAGMTNVTAGAHTGAKPAANISWYEAAAFVNWLNTNAGYHEAYNLSFNSGWSMTLWGVTEQATTGVRSGTNRFRHKDAYYFLPSEDEWYKAAYHQNTGVNANYWDYATGSNTIPIVVANSTASGTAVYSGQSGPADVTQAGGLSAYGTMGQNGNVWEWNESAFDGINSSSFEFRVARGGFYGGSEEFLRASFRAQFAPANEFVNVGFRVASIPEPSAVVLMLMGLATLLVRRRMTRSL